MIDLTLVIDPDDGMTVGRLVSHHLGLNSSGIIYRQVTTIKGANGQIIEGVRLGWIKERYTGIIRLINALPPKEKSKK